MPSRQKTLRARIVIVDEGGTTYQGEALLSVTTVGLSRRSVRPRTQSTQGHATLEFKLPDVAFVKRHAKGLSGPEKFVLVLSYMAKGMRGVEVRARDIMRFWNRMTVPHLLGCKYHPQFAKRAREAGWVDTKGGKFVLLDAWEGALSSREKP